MFHRLPSDLMHKEEPKRSQLEPWEEERAREVLRAMGRISDFRVEDMDKDELREKVEIVQRSKRMRYASSITQERLSSTAHTGSRLIWDEVMK